MRLHFIRRCHYLHGVLGTGFGFCVRPFSFHFLPFLEPKTRGLDVRRLKRSGVTYIFIRACIHTFRGEIEDDNSDNRNGHAI